MCETSGRRAVGCTRPTSTGNQATAARRSLSSGVGDGTGTGGAGLPGAGRPGGERGEPSWFGAAFLARRRPPPCCRPLKRPRRAAAATGSEERPGRRPRPGVRRPPPHSRPAEPRPRKGACERTSAPGRPRAAGAAPQGAAPATQAVGAGVRFGSFPRVPGRRKSDAAPCIRKRRPTWHCFVPRGATHVPPVRRGTGPVPPRATRLRPLVAPVPLYP
jgi:hypothetical protein